MNKAKIEEIELGVIGSHQKRCSLQHDMLDEDRLLHAMPTRRRSFGMIC